MYGYGNYDALLAEVEYRTERFRDEARTAKLARAGRARRSKRGSGPSRWRRSVK